MTDQTCCQSPRLYPHVCNQRPIDGPTNRSRGEPHDPRCETRSRHGRPRCLEALRKTPAAAQLAALLYGDSVPDGLGAASPMWLAGNAEAALAFIGEKPRAGHKVRVRSGPADASRGERLRHRDPQRRHAVPRRFGHGRAEGAGPGRAPAPAPDLQDASATRPAGSRPCSGPGDQGWSDGRQESYIAIYLDKPLSDAAQADLVGALSAVLDEVRAAVTDWKPMLRLVEATARRLEEARSSLPAGVREESVAFLRWLAAGNFTFLGAREYRLAGNAETGNLVPATAEGLGVLRDPERARARSRGGPGRHDARLPPPPHHQGERPGPRAPARLHGLRERQDLSPARGP